nr:hypothetical protein [Candidatus Njordarchaeum guaymaensis]
MNKICGIIIGETRSEEDAAKLAENMKNCPNLLTVATSSNKVYYVFMVPQEKEWWLRYPEKNPKATGLEKASVYIARNITYPKEFSRRLPKKKARTAPCGADCRTCTLREEYSCTGCPATLNYKGK